MYTKFETPALFGLLSGKRFGLFANTDLEVNITGPKLIGIFEVKGQLSNIELFKLFEILSSKSVFVWIDRQMEGDSPTPY